MIKKLEYHLICTKENKTFSESNIVGLFQGILVRGEGGSVWKKTFEKSL